MSVDEISTLFSDSTLDSFTLEHWDELTAWLADEINNPRATLLFDDPPTPNDTDSADDVEEGTLTPKQSLSVMGDFQPRISCSSIHPMTVAAEAEARTLSPSLSSRASSPFDGSHAELVFYTSLGPSYTAEEYEENERYKERLLIRVDTPPPVAPLAPARHQAPKTNELKRDGSPKSSTEHTFTSTSHIPRAQSPLHSSRSHPELSYKSLMGSTRKNRHRRTIPPIPTLRSSPSTPSFSKPTLHQSLPPAFRPSEHGTNKLYNLYTNRGTKSPTSPLVASLIEKSKHLGHVHPSRMRKVVITARNFHTLDTKTLFSWLEAETCGKPCSVEHVTNDDGVYPEWHVMLTKVCKMSDLYNISEKTRVDVPGIGLVTVAWLDEKDKTEEKPVPPIRPRRKSLTRRIYEKSLRVLH